MSTLPPGQPRPTSAAVYRRRRIVVFLGLIAVITAVVLIIVRPGQSAPAPTPTKTVSKPVVTVTPTATPSPTPTVNVADYKECSVKSLVVLPIVDAVDFQAGVNPQLSLSIQNTGKTACFYNVGTNAQVFTITSGLDTYWVSTDCQTDATETLAILEPGIVYPSAPFTWARERSSPDSCGEAREQVPSGGSSYYLSTKVGEVSSKSGAQFLLY